LVGGMGWGETYHVILCIYVGLLTSCHLIGQFSCFALTTMTPISLAAAHVRFTILLSNDALRSDSDSLTVFEPYGSLRDSRVFLEIGT
jgi:hypothetical protein